LDPNSADIEPTGRRSIGAADEAMIEACLRGESRAWGQFVDRYRRLVYAVPSRLGLPPDACDDVFQSVFAVVLRELPNVRDRSSLPKWLMTIAHHEAYRWIRRSRRADRSGAASGPLPHIEPEPAEDVLERLEQRQLIHDAVEELDPRCRDLLTSLFLERAEPSYQEISRRLNMPLGAIGPTRNRCLRKLLALLGDRLDSIQDE
jgi:RNA polymerase sigma factor (sigma-70 family)